MTSTDDCTVRTVRSPRAARTADRFAVACAFVFAASFGGCVGGEVLPSDLEAPSTAGASELRAPSRAEFKLVGDALVAGCGTLDCHGQPGRNLRLYGNHGLRLRGEDNPGGNPTTDAEYDATYWSTIGLEPEILAEVVIAKGAHPERLQLFRKGRGDDKHKGGHLMKPGDPFDRCLQTWLAGKMDETVCTAAIPRNPASEEEIASP